MFRRHLKTVLNGSLGLISAFRDLLWDVVRAESRLCLVTGKVLDRLLLEHILLAEWRSVL